MGNSLETKTDLFDPLMRAGFPLVAADRIISGAEHAVTMAEFKEEINQAIRITGQVLAKLIPHILAEKQRDAENYDFCRGMQWK